MMSYMLLLFLTLFAQSIASLKEPLDLTRDFNKDTLYWKGVRRFEFTKQVAQKAPAGYFYSINEFCAGEHGGTHLDAPYHFNENGIKAGEIPLKDLIAPGVVIDISEEVTKGGPSTNLKVEHLEQWVKEHGELPSHCVMLVKFGWSQYWPDKQKYFNIQEDDEYFFPGITKEAAQWIVDSKKVVGVGVDVASVDPGMSKTLDAHVIMHGQGLYHMENVDIKDELPARNFTLFVMPMKITNGSGAPLRLVATPPVNFLD